MDYFNGLIICVELVLINLIFGHGYQLLME